MWAGIGTNLRIFFIAATLSFTSYSSFCQGFYVGGKKCIDVPAPSPPPADGKRETADCNEPTIFFDTEKDATAWSWNFGDGGTATSRNPQHLYKTVGTYTVTLTRTVGALVQAPVTQTITISKPPAQPKFFEKISGDTTVCDGKTLKLDPYSILKGGSPAEPGVTYLWFPNGETTPTITVTKPGCYSVEVFDPSGQCSRTAKINVKFCLQSAGGGGLEKWYFGNGATLNFEAKVDTKPKDPNDGKLFEDPEQTDPTYAPGPASGSNPVNSPAGVAMLYDPSNNLLFYTDGVKIYNKDDQALAFMPPLTNSDLGGENGTTQSAIIVPKGSCNECPHHIYYAYTLNKTTGLLSYSIIDLRRDNGKGAVVEKDIPVSFTTGQQVAARKTQNEDGYFVYSHEKETNVFRILKVDSTGVKETTQAIGLVHDNTSPVEGYMRLSPSGNKMAVAVTKGTKNYVEIYDVNADTGELKLTLTIDVNVAAPPYIYGVEFSGNEDLLYITLRGDPAAGTKSYLYQLNLNIKDPLEIAQKKNLIDQSSTMAFGALQMGPVGGGGSKFIYMAVDGSNEIPYIMSPENIGGAALVGYQPISAGFGAPLNGTSHYGLPNVIQAVQKQDGDGVSAEAEGLCEGQPTKFSTQGVCSPMENKIKWDFGDGTTGTGKDISHTYAKAGVYKVKMTVEVLSETGGSKVISQIPIIGKTVSDLAKEKCNEFTYEDELTINQTPVSNLPDIGYVCVIEGASILLDPKAQNTVNPLYLWNWLSSTTPTVSVDATGNVTLKITNRFPNGGTCEVDDKIELKEGCEPRLFVPEVFTPNGDGLNDTFVLPNAHITDFDLKIYNRWGEIIFESFDSDIPWDGTYKGKVMAPMLYAFVVSYKSEYFPERPKITKSGGIMLVK